MPSTFDYSFTFTKVDERKTVTTPLQETTTYVYDRDRRLKKVIFPSSTPQAEYELENFYSGGLLDYTEVPEGTIDYEYGSCGNQVQSDEQ